MPTIHVEYSYPHLPKLWWNIDAIWTLCCLLLFIPYSIPPRNPFIKHVFSICRTYWELRGLTRLIMFKVFFLVQRGSADQYLDVIRFLVKHPWILVKGRRRKTLDGWKPIESQAKPNERSHCLRKRKMRSHLQLCLEMHDQPNITPQVNSKHARFYARSKLCLCFHGKPLIVYGLIIPVIFPILLLEQSDG